MSLRINLTFPGPEEDESLRNVRSIDQVRDFYGKFATQLPDVGRYWKAYIEHEEEMAKAHGIALGKVGLDISSYSIYSDYISFLKFVQDEQRPVLLKTAVLLGYKAANEYPTSSLDRNFP
ncbi:hypothetical protein KIN20_029855 [Parelaphostrongylus tenuis]|uniref:Suppressor of forked domain-containing protein n=1 Tax=Parelaphostrongylus tenuis TaxID=148309 RepID=A0AAD5R349_PARTN|nr:hypothetical protein KIN20_029855 [Parelaphostrongylus tenuis]